MSKRDLLHVLFRRKWVVIGFFLASLAGGYAGLKFIAPSYEATGRLLMRLGSEDVYMPTLPTSQFRTPVVNIVREEQLRSESAILTDPDLARRVVDELTAEKLFPGIHDVHPWYTPKGLLQQLKQGYGAVENYFFPLSAQRTVDDRAVGAFQRALRVEPIKTSSVIEVSLRSKSPEAAAEGVNTLIRRYLDQRVHIHQRVETGFYDEQLKQVNAQLAETEKQIDSYRARGQILDLDKQRTAQVEQLNEVRKRLDENRVQIGQSERRLEVLRQQLAETSPTVQVGGGEHSNPQALSELARQLAEVQRREAEIRQAYSERDPRLAALRDERAALQKMLDEQQKRRETSSQQGINPLHTRIRDDLLQAEAGYAALQETQSKLGGLEREVVGRLGGFNRQDAGYQQLAQRLEVLRETRQLYLGKTEEARLAAQQAQARLGNVSVISAAIPDTRPVSPKLWLVLIGVLIGGLVGGLGLAFLLEALDDSLRSEADVRKYLDLPLLARVPELN